MKTKSSAIGLIALLLFTVANCWAQAGKIIEVDTSAAAHPFPHYWEQMFGSGRAILSLRDSYRQDLRQVKEITGFKYVRFHAIFHDEVGVYDETEQGKPVYNFSYVDQI
jgi:xylan 1,4-beta-xylosidase